MRIVHIEDFFHPEAGYQINILTKYMAKAGHDVFIVTAEMDKMPDFLTNFFGKDDIGKKDKIFEINTGVKVIRTPMHCYYSGRALFKGKIFKIIEELKPDALFVHGNDTYIGIRYSFKMKKVLYPVVFDNHMVDMASENSLRELFYWFYRIFITPIINKNEIYVIRTAEDDFIFKHFKIKENLAPVISFGSDLLLFHPDLEVRKCKRKKLELAEDDFTVIYAGKLDESKGGKFLAEALLDEFVCKRNVVFLIVGNTVGEYGAEVESLFAQSKNRIIRLPTQKYVDLPALFQSADLALFPKQVSLTFFDVQACGLPVVFEYCDINVQRATEGGAVCFKNGDINDFRDKISMMVNLNDKEFESYRQKAIVNIIDNYSYQQQADKFIEIVEKVVAENNMIVRR